MKNLRCSCDESTEIACPIHPVSKRLMDNYFKLNKHEKAKLGTFGAKASDTDSQDDKSRASSI